MRAIDKLNATVTALINARALFLDTSANTMGDVNETDHYLRDASTVEDLLFDIHSDLRHVQDRITTTLNLDEDLPF